MPIYCFRCQNCGYQTEEFFRSRSDVPDVCPVCNWNLDRDFSQETTLMLPDWEPGFNPSIWSPYKNKKDLISQIKRRGLTPALHGGGVTSASPGLYGDEEYKDMYTPSPRIGEELE